MSAAKRYVAEVEFKVGDEASGDMSKALLDCISTGGEGIAGCKHLATRWAGASAVANEVLVEQRSIWSAPNETEVGGAEASRARRIAFPSWKRKNA